MYACHDLLLTCTFDTFDSLTVDAQIIVAGDSAGGEPSPLWDSILDALF
jgi:hypothetical protein